MEAYKQAHVKAALTGVSSLNLGKWTQTMVPIKEMVDVLKVKRGNIICFMYFYGIAPPPPKSGASVYLLSNGI